MSVEVKSRRATNDEICESARKLGARAQPLGWRVEFTYARGEAPGRSVKVIDSLCVRFSRRVKYPDPFTESAQDGFAVVVAVYEDGKFRCGLTPQHRLNMRELVAVLEHPEGLTAA